MFRKKSSGKRWGLLLYSNIQDIICAQSALQREGLGVTLVPPPMDIAIGCDLAVQFNLIEEELIKGLIHRGLILPGEFYTVEEPIKAVENLTRITEIAPGFLMANCHNIKVTVDKSNHEIVNISGGGCPDIPHVAHSLIGLSLENCPDPIEIGFSLCTYMVQLALDSLRQEVKIC